MNEMRSYGYNPGRFKLPGEVLERAPDKVQSLFSNCIPVRIEFMWDTRTAMISQLFRCRTIRTRSA